MAPLLKLTYPGSSVQSLSRVYLQFLVALLMQLMFLMLVAATYVSHACSCNLCFSCLQLQLMFLMLAVATYVSHACSFMMFLMLVAL